MAQRSFSCPKCGADVYIPDNFFQPAILCAKCGAAVNRHDGELFEGDPAGLDTSSSTPSPARRTGTHTGSRAKPLVLFGIVVLVLIGGGLAALYLMGQDDSGNDAPPADQWVRHESRSGGFSALFPNEPKSLNESYSVGTENLAFQRTWVRAAGHTFDVMYVDAPLEEPADAGARMREMLRFLAETRGREVSDFESASVSGVAGLRGEIKLQSGRLMTALVVRAKYRFLVAYVEGHGQEDAETVARFLNSLELDPAVANPTKMQARVNIPAYLKRDDNPDVGARGEEEEAPDEEADEEQEAEPGRYIELSGGTPPYRVRRPQVLPEGLRGRIEGSRYVLEGAPLIIGNSRVEFEFEDAYGQLLKDVTHELRVVPSGGPILFDGSFVRDGVVGAPYEAWVEIVNYVPDLVEYDVVWNDLALPDGLTAEHLTEDEEKSEAGLEPNADYIIVRGTPRRAETSSCEITLIPRAPEDTGLEPEEQSFTFEIEIKSDNG